MSNLSSEVLKYMRSVVAPHNVRPIAALLFVDPEYPNNATTYRVTLTATTIGINRPGAFAEFLVSYVGMSTFDVATQLAGSPYPIEVSAMADIASLKSGELLATGASIPNGFNFFDISDEGNGSIVRCKRWAINFDKLSTMLLKAPYDEESNLPWWPRITYGKFVQKENGITYHFDIPEYKSQTWSSRYGAPFVDVAGEQANFVGAKKIKTDKKPILFKNNNIAFASIEGERVYPSSIIKYVDSINGYIYLNDGVDLPDSTLLYYTHLERSFVYHEINVNGHFSQNPFLLDKYVVFYALSVKSNSGINRSRGIYHSTGDSIDEAINNITNASSSEPIAIIGALSIRPYLDKASINITDTRSYGGGLRDDEIGKRAEARFKESQYFYDIGRVEGIPYPGAAAVVIDLPDYLREVMPLDRIRDRAQKFVAAGVYPILNFEETTTRESDHAADISMVERTFRSAYETMLPSEDIILGPTGEARSWIDSDAALPGDIYGVYASTGLLGGPALSDNTLKISPGKVYYQSYIRGSVDPVFTYEERTVGTEWKKKTVIDKRDIPLGTLAAGKLELDASYGYKEVRNLTGNALFSFTDRAEYYDTIAKKVGQYILDVNSLGVTGRSYAITTGSISNVFTSEQAEIASGDYSPGIPAEYAPLMKYYGALAHNDFMDTQSLIPTFVSQAESRMTTGPGGGRWPQVITNDGLSNHYAGEYRAYDDLYLYSTFCKHRMNKHVSITTNTPTIVVDDVARSAQSGAFFLADTLVDLMPAFGTKIDDTVKPYRFVPVNNSALPLTGINSYSEIDISLNDLHNGLAYTKAMAALYACQDRPADIDYSVGPTIPIDFSPRSIAFSGVDIATRHFSGFYESPALTGYNLSETWLTDYNRTSAWASNYLDTVTTSVDNLYYGNDEWAGWTGHSQKGATRYATVSRDIHFTGDATWDVAVDWLDGKIESPVAHLPALLNSIEANFQTIGRRVKATAGRGGILPPNYVDAVKHFLWLPTHSAKKDPLFQRYGTGLVDIFELGMGAILKGSLSEDGILTEGGGYKHTPAPFSGQVPSSILEACSSAIDYYAATGDSVMENRWTAMFEGLYSTTTGFYEKPGGYPHRASFSILDAPGDPGVRPIEGVLPYLSLKSTAYSATESLAITGDLAPRY